MSRLPLKMMLCSLSGSMAPSITCSLNSCTNSCCAMPRGHSAQCGMGCCRGTRKWRSNMSWTSGRGVLLACKGDNCVLCRTSCGTSAATTLHHGSTMASYWEKCLCLGTGAFLTCVLCKRLLHPACRRIQCVTPQRPNPPRSDAAARPFIPGALGGPSRRNHSGTHGALDAMGTD